MNLTAVLYALIAAALFGISTPVAKVLIGSVHPAVLAGPIVAGGVVGPILLLVGLTRTDASTASLLLTLEGVASALLAWFIFHENFDRRIAIGMLCLVAGAIVLSWSGAP